MRPPPPARWTSPTGGRPISDPAQDGLAHVHRILNDPDRARHHWHTALRLLTGIGTDYTEEPGVTTAAIRAHLLDLDDRPAAQVS